MRFDRGAREAVDRRRPLAVSLFDELEPEHET